MYGQQQQYGQQPPQQYAMQQQPQQYHPNQMAPPPGSVVTQQPAMMQRPDAPPGCPPGLEYLTLLDQVLVKQQVELLEAVIGFETKNKYKVLNVMGQPMYMGQEDSGCLNRQCCGPIRAFEMEITDNFGHDVIHLNRHLRCDSCCFPCCLQKMDVRWSRRQ